MGELGSGGGSGYPSSLDTNNTPEVDSPAAGKTLVRADVPNDTMAAVIAIQTELGTDPAGSQSTVKARIGSEHSTSGAHSTTSVVTSGDTQLITSNKIFTKLNFEATDTGSADAYAFALNGSIASYTDGLEVRGRIANTNTGTSTLSVNGNSNEIIHNPDGSVMRAGQLISGGLYTWIYNGTTSKWILQTSSNLSKVSSDDTTPGYLNGKLVDGDGVDFAEGSGGGDETLTVSAHHGFEVFTSSGTWTRPSSKITSVVVEIVGAGGGGGGNNRGSAGEGSGGGGGGEYKKVVYGVSGNITVTIGAGGAGGAAGTTNTGSTGGNTSFGSTVSNGGAGGTAYQVSSGLGGAGGRGGADTGATSVIMRGAGNFGENGDVTDDGGDGGNPGNMGQVTGFTQLDNGLTATALDGDIGQGGGGGRFNTVGGDGGPGYVIVWF